MSTETITSTQPTLRTDSPPTPIAATEVLTATLFDMIGTGPNTSIGTVTGTPGSPISFTTAALTVGTHNFTVVITDAEGNNSAPSNTITQVVSPTVAPPQAVTITGVFNA